MPLKFRSPITFTKRSDSGFSATNPATWFNWYKDYKRRFKVDVNPRTAEGFAAVYACVDYSACSISTRAIKNLFKA